MKKLILSIAIISFTATGCASKSKDIQATYVSPLQYQHYNCDQLGQEMNRVGRKASEVGGSQDSAANKDAAAMAVGMVLFWPALFFLIGGDKKEELARLKGEHEALESIAIEKQCTTVLADLEAARKRQAEIEKELKEKEEREARQQSET